MPFFQQSPQPDHLQGNDLPQLFLGEPLEDEDVVHPVQELRLEVEPERLHDPVPQDFFVADLGDILAADVGGHDDDGVLKVHRPAVAVGEAAVVQDLEQRVEDLRVGLFDLVKQHHGVGPAAHRFGELAAFLVAHVPRRGADEPGNRVLLHVFAHVQADHGRFRVKQEFGQGPGQFGLAHAGGAQEDEGAQGPVGVL